MKFEWTDDLVKDFAKVYTGAKGSFSKYHGLSIDQKLVEFKKEHTNKNDKEG